MSVLCFEAFEFPNEILAADLHECSLMLVLVLYVMFGYSPN